jgi:putative oxidoreductase
MQKIFGDFVSGRAAIGLLIFRLVVGGALVQHGMGKMFGPKGPTGWMGPDMPGFLQFLAALSEFGGGVAVILGFVTPLACFGIACTMVVAILKGHAGQPWVGSGKPGEHPFESAAFYLATAIMLIITGPGTLSLDSLLFNKANKPVSPERLNKASETGAI